MRKITTADRLRYQFDNTMSRGTIALIGWLAILSLIMILAISLFVFVTGADATGEGGRLGFSDLLWRGLLRTLDPGTMGGDQGSVLFLASMLAITLGGIFLVSTLIGVLTSRLPRAAPPMTTNSDG